MSSESEQGGFEEMIMSECGPGSAGLRNDAPVAFIILIPEMLDPLG